jgi:hypothetical protein
MTERLVLAFSDRQNVVYAATTCVSMPTSRKSSCALIRQALVVAVDAGPVSRFTAHAEAAHSGQDRGNDIAAEGEQGADGARGGCRDVVAAGPAGFVHDLLALELAQVISRLPDGIAVVAAAFLGA